MSNPLTALLALSDEEKASRGLKHTPAEIHQQPESWLITLDHLASLRPSVTQFLDNFFHSADPAPREVLLAGAGTSDYIGRTISRTLRRQWQCPVNAVPSTELLTNLDDFILPRKRYLLVSFSRSGDSSEGVALIHQTLRRFPQQIQHLVITCNPDGKMAQTADVFPVILDRSANDLGLAMTSSYTNMVIAGEYLAHAHTPESFDAAIRQVSAAASRAIPQMADTAAAFAKRRWSRACFIGAGALQAVAEESALKALELTAGRVATVAQSALGLRHGPMSFLNHETLGVAYISSNSTRQQYELDLVQEIRDKHLAGDILLLTPSAIPRAAELTGHVINLDLPAGIADDVLPPAYILIAQLLGLFFSIEYGMRPDSPGEGAITRVVSHVQIHQQ